MGKFSVTENLSFEGTWICGDIDPSRKVQIIIDSGPNY